MSATALSTALGAVLSPKPPALPGLARPTIFDGRALCAMALAAYLRCAEFIRWGGPTGENVTFRLCHVLEEWPESSHVLEYPTASIIDVSDTVMGAPNFTPMPVESSWNVHGCNTVLWKLDEITLPFQVDFWLQSNADREAVAAALPGLFSPGETQTGVFLSTGDLQYGVPVRATLESMRRMDVSQSVYQQERRLQTRIRCDVDVVELRCATELAPELRVGALSPTETLPASDSASSALTECT